MSIHLGYTVYSYIMKIVYGSVEFCTTNIVSLNIPYYSATPIIMTNDWILPQIIAAAQAVYRVIDQRLQKKGTEKQNFLYIIKTTQNNWQLH